jgi:NADH:ubiquinone oxidoreductase subunit C
MTTDTETCLQTASEFLSAWTLTSAKPEASRLDIVLPRTNLLDAVNALVTAHWGFLSAITGLDHPGAAVPDEGKAWDRLASDAEAGGAASTAWLEVLYHFCHGAAVLTLRVRLSYQNPSIASICSLIPSANLYERELSEMFGIEVLGLPQAGYLLLPDDWPKGIYPLRKEFTGFNHDNQKTGTGKDHD